jgi:hypothetical protein
VDRLIAFDGGPTLGGQRWDRFGFFLNLDCLGPNRVDRAGSWTVQDRGPSGFGPARPGPDRLRTSNCRYGITIPLVGIYMIVISDANK